MPCDKIIAYINFEPMSTQHQLSSPPSASLAFHNMVNSPIYLTPLEVSPSSWSSFNNPLCAMTIWLNPTALYMPSQAQFHAGFPYIALQPQPTNETLLNLGNSNPLHFNSYPLMPSNIKSQDVPCTPTSVSTVKAEPLSVVQQAVAAQKLRPKKKIIDKDYLPHRSEKTTIRKRLHQNENRNIVPNQINQVLSFLQKRNKSEKLLTVIFAKHPPPCPSFTPSRFYLYQSLLKEHSGHYSNQQCLKLLGSLYEPQHKIWSLDQQRYYITISRLLVGHFLRQDSIPIILTSKRMKSNKKFQHLRIRRIVRQKIINLIREGAKSR